MNFQRISIEFSTNFHWIFNEFPMNFQRISIEFQTNFQGLEERAMLHGQYHMTFFWRVSKLITIFTSLRCRPRIIFTHILIVKITTDAFLIIVWFILSCEWKNALLSRVLTAPCRLFHISRIKIFCKLRRLIVILYLCSMEADKNSTSFQHIQWQYHRPRARILHRRRIKESCHLCILDLSCLLSRVGEESV